MWVTIETAVTVRLFIRSKNESESLFFFYFFATDASGFVGGDVFVACSIALLYLLRLIDKRISCLWITNVLQFTNDCNFLQSFANRKLFAFCKRLFLLLVRIVLCCCVFAHNTTQSPSTINNKPFAKCKRFAIYK